MQSGSKLLRGRDSGSRALGIHAFARRSHGEIDLPDPRQHPRLVGRIKTSVEIDHDIVGAGRLGLRKSTCPSCPVEHATQAMREVVFLHDAAGPEIPLDQQIEELPMSPFQR